MSSSTSSSDGSSGGAVEASRGGVSISALFSSSDAGTSLGGVSSSAGSPILLSGSPEAKQPVAEAVEQVIASEASGDLISIDVRNEGEHANLPEVQGYDWAPYEPRTHATRFRWERLTLAERADLAVLKTLPNKIPPRPLIQCLRSPDLPRAVYDIMARTTVSNAEFLARTVPTPATTTPTGASGVVIRPRFAVKPPGFGAAGAATDKGKKSKRDDYPTGRSSKKSKKGEASGSLATALLGSDVRLDEEVSFHFGPRMKDMIKDVSGEEALRTTGELTFRLAAIYTKFPRPDRSRMESLEQELAAAKTELREVKASASDLNTQFDRLNGLKAEHAKCASLLKAADDWAKEEHTKAKEATEELRKVQQRFDDLTLEHMAAAGSATDWQRKAKKYQAELRVADEHVFAQYETGFQSAVDQAIFYYHCSPDRFDVHLGVVDGKLERVFDRLDEVNDPLVDN
ncbi:hypothetical protein DEO72_LG5g2555 [Vigna unguiculata]|uniref:Uncharacterized protein n=1 Tax=Vigna unguiculata TaxID=3917 RepID=A0A4D6M1N5_VIGUN|nr:hypothetical protein DEO72_LG5g2555 [Vigna unguiculata]